MRKNTRDALERWSRGIATPLHKQGGAVWTDGHTIFSYQTAMVARLPNGSLRCNVTRYSTTTSIQQGGLHYGLFELGYVERADYVSVDDVPAGPASLRFLLA
jgi:hypothetical protein